MTRSELIERLALEKNISTIVDEKIIMEIFKSMAETLASGTVSRLEVLGVLMCGSMTATLPATPKQVFSSRSAPRNCPSSRPARTSKNAYWMVGSRLELYRHTRRGSVPEPLLR